MPIQAQLALGLTVLLADDQKSVAVAGIGWTVRQPEPEPIAVSITVYIPRDQAGIHRWRLELVYADGAPVRLDEPVVGIPDDFVFEGEQDVRGLDDPSLTTPLTLGFAIGLPPFPLPEGREFLWRLTVDGETRDGWTLPFRTTPPVAVA
jgi:hypothetical protein